MRATTSLPEPAGPVIITRDPVGGAFDLPAQLRHWHGIAEQNGFRAGAEAEFGVFARQRGGFERAPDDQQQAVGLERLLDEIISALLDGSDCHLYRAMARDHDDRDLWFFGMDHLQKAETIHA